MKPVVIPTVDVNSETAVIIKWHAGDRCHVQADDLLVEIETSKAVIQIESPGEGLILHVAPEGAEVPLSEPIGHLFATEDELLAFASQRAADKQRREEPSEGYRATAKAKQLALEHGLDIESLYRGQLITTKEVEKAIRAAVPLDYSKMPAPLSVKAGVERLLLIGGGLGATQVIDILRDGASKKAVAILDDNRDIWGTEVCGIPVVGGSDRLESLYGEGTFESVIICISTSVPARTKFRQACHGLGIPMTNAIDRTTKLSADVKIGTGNVICAFCYFGTGAVIGDNNFISAYNSYDHHSTLASDISTGPGCMASGLVKIGDRVRMGTGVFIEPHVEIGDGAQVASGAIILRSVPAEHAVKKIITSTVIVPIRRRPDARA